MSLSTSARITLANSLLLAVSFAALLLLVTLLSERFMVSHVHESVESELHIMEAEWQVDSTRGVIALIGLRMQNTSLNHDRIYRLEDAKGKQLAGNLDAWPQAAAPAGKTFKRPSRKYPGETEVIFQWTKFRDGTRLLVGFDEIEVATVRADIRRAALWSFGAVLVVAMSMGFLLTRAALRPVEAIRIAAQRIMEGDLRHRVPARANGDEFDRLGETLNAMLDRINALIASMKGATDNIAHDLRSPLTRHRARLEAALRTPLSQELVPALLESSLADLDQVLATFQSLLRIATVESGLLRQEFEPCGMTQLVHDAADYIEPLAEDRGQTLKVSIDPGPPLNGHRHLLFQLLINLLDNAVKYSPANTAISLCATATARQWTIEVADSGPGIPQQEHSRIFERLYRLDASRHTPGLGLGLSLAKAITDLHGATIHIHNNQPGTRMQICIPQGAA